MGGALPHDLGEMTPFVEVGHAGLALAIVWAEVALLIVVHQISDHLTDVVCADAVSNVLTISATVDAPVARV